MPKALMQKFPDLPRKMFQVLRQGGKGFQDFYEPLQIDVTTPTEFFQLLRHYKDGQQLTAQLCRANGLTMEPAECMEDLEERPLYKVRPDKRIDSQLTFPPTARVASRLIRRWMRHGSIVRWVEALAAKIGSVEKDSADAYLAREVMFAGLALATLLDEFHPSLIVYSATAERIARR